MNVYLGALTGSAGIPACSFRSRYYLFLSNRQAGRDACAPRKGTLRSQGSNPSDLTVA